MVTESNAPEVPINYRDFWDVPRIFFAEHAGRLYLFDCQFDEDTEDYPESYQVFLMPPLTDLDFAGSWADLWRKAVRKVGDVPVAAVRFDPTRRQAIGAEVFDLLGLSGPPANGAPDHADPAPARSP
jgi:hypothetical protein